MLLDALGYVGESLMKPGRVVRGAMFGRGDELLAGLPFSDTLGITDPSRAVTGSMLLDELGYAAPEDSTERMLTGIGADIATDPLTFVGGALLSRGAKAIAGLGGAGRTAGMASSAPAEIAKLAPQRSALEAVLGNPNTIDSAIDLKMIDNLPPLPAAVEDAARGVPVEAWDNPAHPFWTNQTLLPPAELEKFVNELSPQWMEIAAKHPEAWRTVDQMTPEFWARINSGAETNLLDHVNPESPYWANLKAKVTPIFPKTAPSLPSLYAPKSLENVHMHQWDDDTLMQMLIRDQSNLALRDEAYQRALDAGRLDEAELLLQSKHPIYWDGRRVHDAIEVMESGGLSPEEIQMLESAISTKAQNYVPHDLRLAGDLTHESLAPSAKARLLADWWHFQDQHAAQLGALEEAMRRLDFPLGEIPRTFVESRFTNRPLVVPNFPEHASLTTDQRFLRQALKDLEQAGTGFQYPPRLKTPDDWVYGFGGPPILDFVR